MAEGFEHYHVPQQSRRDKLRVFAQNQPSFVESSSILHPTCPPLTSLYDPSLIPSDLLACATQQGAAAKGEGSNLMMGFVEGGVVNGDAIHVINSNSNHHNNNPFLYQIQNLREFGDGYNDASEMMVFKPEPLSLSLSSQTNNTHHPLELNLQRFGAVIPGLVGRNSEVSRNSVPLGPFTGYASILKGSRFLKPAQQLLEELCDGGVRGIYATEKSLAPDASLMEPPHEGLSASGVVGGDDPLGEYENESRKKKCRLLTMLDEVYRRYRHYYQQMHAVITSFEYVSGLGNAAPFASLAINAMSKHFKGLKSAITDQLQFINKAPFQISNRKDESPRLHSSDRGTYSQRPGFLEHQQPVWRPQRGLPERAVSVLRAWLFEHFLHPYPTDTDKIMLAKQTGLSRNQVSNWFINARVRLWKPMVEEIHMLESQQAQKRPQREEQNRRNLSVDHLPSDNSLVTENPSSSMEKFQDTLYKQHRNEIANMQVRGQEQLNQTNTRNQQVGVGVSMGSGGGGASSNNGVSLTLGLHQNHGIGLSEQVPPYIWQPAGSDLQLMMSNELTSSYSGDPISCFSLSKNDSYLMSTSGGPISLFSMSSFKTLTTIMPPPPMATCLTFYPRDNNILAVGMDDLSILIYNVCTNKIISKLEGHSKRVSDLAFSISFDLLVSIGVNDEIFVWDTNEWKKRKEGYLQIYGRRLPEVVSETHIQFHLYQRHFLVVRSDYLAMYEATDLKCCNQWVPQVAVVISQATFSSDGQAVYVSFVDGNVAILDTLKFQIRCRINLSTYLSTTLSSSISALAIAAHPHKPSQFVVGLTDGRIFVFEPRKPEDWNRFSR